jgi:HEAT repeat protein
MKKRVKVAFVLLLLAAAGLVVWQVLSPKELLYQGKSLGFWLGGRDPFSTTAEERLGLDEAFRHMGTNAVPALLRMLSARDSQMVLKLVGLAQKQNLVSVRYVPAETRRSQAVYGLHGIQTRMVVPAVVQIYEDNTCPPCQIAAADVLADLGPNAEEALPSLLRGLSSTNEALLAYTAYAIGLISLVRPHPQECVPALVRLLNHPSHFVRARVANALGHFGPAAKEAVPGLKQLRTDTDEEVRQYTEYALKAIDPQSREADGEPSSNPAQPKH